MTFTQKLVEFVTNHWAMTGGFILLLIILFYEEMRSKGMGSAVSVHEAVNLINREDAVVIDTRDSDAFVKGHINKARNIPADQIEQNITKLQAFKEKPLIVVSARGQSCLAVAAKLRKAGFERAQTLKGGMHAWEQESMPLKKK